MGEKRLRRGRDGPLLARKVAVTRCPTCKRVVRDDYLVVWREVRRGGNGYRGFARPYYLPAVLALPDAARERGAHMSDQLARRGARVEAKRG